MAHGREPGDRSEDVLARVLDGLGPDDPASAPAHAEASADVDRIRRALHAIGTEAARDAPVLAQRPTRVAGRRWTGLRRLALPAAVVLTLLTSVIGLTRLNGSSDGGSGGSEGYHEYYISCASTIVEGDILSTRPAARPGHLRLTLGALDRLVPATGPRRTELEIEIPRPAGAPPVRTGQRQLFFAWRNSDRVNVYPASDIRKQAWRELLPRARHFSDSQCAEAAREAGP